MNKYLRPTTLLNYEHPSIQNIVQRRHWKSLSEKEKVFSIYNFVRDDIHFGYNVSDDLRASDILADGYGQCNTKGILFMALLRASDVPCRFHGFTIDKKLQKGAITGLWYMIAPDEIVHSWVELLYGGSWLNIEGFILDMNYLQSLQSMFSDCSDNFCGYGAATPNLQYPNVEWSENDTYIQKEGIVQDLGTFNSPDEFFSQYAQNIKGIKKLLFENIIRHSMNRNIERIRNRR